MPLRNRLFLVIAVPLFVLLGFAGTGIKTRLDDLSAQREYGRLRSPTAALATVSSSLQDEGVLSTWAGAAPADQTLASRLGAARDATDRAVISVQAVGRGLGDDVASSTRRAWDALVAHLAGLRTLRIQVDERAGLPSVFGDRFADLDTETLDVAELVAKDVDDRTLSTSMQAVLVLAGERAASAREAMIVVPYLVAGSSSQLSQWVSTINAQAGAVAEFAAVAQPAERAAFDAARSGERPVDPIRSSNTELLNAFPTTTVTPVAYYDYWQDKQGYLGSGANAVQLVIDEQAADRESEVLGDVMFYGIGVAILGLGVLVLAWIVVRSINRSLREVTQAAQEIAEVRLPHLLDSLRTDGELPAEATEIRPVPVLTNDELGDLAKSFNAVQEATLKVAHEQSVLLRKGIGDLYVNLARRNQSLVDRQISLLDNLEARTEDPDQLASFFELDHLATRMRRNAESLLVMSGATQPRQWSESIPVLDVVRAAAGEIADFPRVVFTGFDTNVAIAGNAVADVTHILAELLENATAFSPPGTPVVVAGMVAEHRFVITVTDEGIGIDDARLAAANDLLTRPPAPGLALSRSLGLHVVAHLAARYRIRVQLRRSMAQGVTAIVALPPELLTRGSLSERRDHTHVVADGGPDDELAPRPTPAKVEYPFPRPGEAPLPAPAPTAVRAMASVAPPMVPPAPTAAAPVSAPPAPVAPAAAPAPWDAPVFDPPRADPFAVVTDDDASVAGEALFFDVSASVELPRRVPGRPVPTAPLGAQPVSAPPTGPTVASAPPAPVASAPAAPPIQSFEPAAPTGAFASQPARAARGTPPGEPPPVEFPFPSANGIASQGAASNGASPGAGSNRATSGAAEPSAARWSDREFPDDPLDEYSIDPETGLPRRTPGLHLTHDPTQATGPVDGDPRPRPERVHDLLTRHLHGIRHGRSDAAHERQEDET